MPVKYCQRNNINIVKEITINCSDSDSPIFRVFPSMADESFHNNPYHTG